MYISNFFKHLGVVTRHRFRVFLHCARCGIAWRGLVHDLSKYSPTEFFESVKYYRCYRSPIGACREEIGYSRAWLHHKGRNRHHFEYWTDYNPYERKICPVKMPTVFVKEMFCDRLAASKIYQGENYTENHPIEYFMRGKPNRNIHPETSDLIEEWLRIVAESGEAAAFKEIKNCKEY